MHDLDSKPPCIGRTVEQNGFAIENHLTFVCTVYAAEDFDEGRFPRAVLADQAMHLSRRQVERDVAQCRYAVELLGDGPQFEQPMLTWHRPGPAFSRRRLRCPWSRGSPVRRWRAAMTGHR